MSKMEPAKSAEFMMGDIGVLIGPVAERLLGISVYCADRLVRNDELMVKVISTNFQKLEGLGLSGEMNLIMVTRKSSLLNITPPISMENEENPYVGTPYHKGGRKWT